MGRVLRLCNPSEISYLMEFDGDKPRGIFGELIGSLSKSLERFTNISVVVRSKEDGFGADTNGVYDGCIGRIQRNESDFIARLVDYPFPAPGVLQGDIIMDSVIQFLSIYRPRKKRDVQDVDLESSFNSFDRSVWLLCLLTVILGYAALRIQYALAIRMRMLHLKFIGYRGIFPKVKRVKCFLYRVATHMTARGEVSTSRAFFKRILYLSLSLFSFLVIFLFSTSIKTELVATKAPLIYRSYEDLLEHNVSIIFLRGMELERSFKNAPKSSIERRLWNLSVARHSLKGIFYELDPGKFSDAILALATGKIVFITDSIFSPALLADGCSTAVDEKKMKILLGDKLPLEPRSGFPLVSQDAQADVTLKGFLYNMALEKGLLMRLRSFSGRILQSALVSKVLKLIGDGTILERILRSPNTKHHQGLIDDCSNKIIYKPHIELACVKVANMQNFMLHLMALLSIAALVLVMEIVTSSKR